METDHPNHTHDSPKGWDGIALFQNSGLIVHLHVEVIVPVLSVLGAIG